MTAYVYTPRTKVEVPTPGKDPTLPLREAIAANKAALCAIELRRAAIRAELKSFTPEVRARTLAAARLAAALKDANIGLAGEFDAEFDVGHDIDEDGNILPRLEAASQGTFDPKRWDARQGERIAVYNKRVADGTLPQPSSSGDGPPAYCDDPEGDE